MDAAADADDRQFLLKNQMLDGLLAAADIDGGFLDVQEGRQDAGSGEVGKLGFHASHHPVGDSSPMHR